MKHRSFRLPLGFSALVLLFSLLSLPFIASTALAEGEAAAAFPVIADFEGGVPADWFQYGDGGNTGTAAVVTVSDTDGLALPGQTGDNAVLSVTINTTSWAGFGAALNPTQDWSDYDALSFWYYGQNLSTTHDVEIQTAAGDDRRATFVDDFMGWRQIVLPFNTFGGGGAYDVSEVDNWVFVLDGTVGTFALDNLQLVNLSAFANFEGGVPADWFQYGDGGNTGTAAVVTVSDTDGLALPGQMGDNAVLSVTINTTSWAGFGAALNPTQDWSDMQGVSFWYYGQNLSTTHEFEIQTAAGDDRRATFVDDFMGWQQIVLPFTAFGDGSPYDVSEVDNWVFVLDGTIGSFALDNLSTYGDAGNITPRLQFSTDVYEVVEGEVATVTVQLNTAPTENITVTFTINDGTTTVGEDYEPLDTNGSLIFAPNAGSLVFGSGVTEQSFAIQTIDDTLKESAIETATLTLSSPQGAELGVRGTATLNINDNESICSGRVSMVDTFENYADTLPFDGQDANGNRIGFLIDFSIGSTMTVTTTQVISPNAMAVPGQAVTNTILKIDSNILSWGAFIHEFENEAVDAAAPQDWSTYEGIAFWVYGTGSGVDIALELRENRPIGATEPDDGGPEIWNYTFADDIAGWRYVEIPWERFGRKEIGNGAPNDGLSLEQVHGWAFLSLASGGDQTHYFDNVQVCGERVVERTLDVNFTRPEFSVTEGQTATLSMMLNMAHTEAITVDYIIQETGATPGVDYEATGGSLVFAPGETEQSFTVPTYQDDKYEADERAVFVMTSVSTGTLGFQQRGVLVIEEDDPFNPALLADYETGQHQMMVGEGLTVTVTAIEANAAEALPNQVHPEHVLSVTYNILSNTNPFPAGFEQQFGGSQSWLNYEGFSFWMYGHNSGQAMQVELLGQREADPGPEGWELVWSDEFSETAGTPPNPKYWTHEIGDGALNGITGWGNGEFQYYTDSTDNAATDGNGNLVITARKVDTNTTSLTCWYGPCEYTSARLISKNKIDFAYGRIEARVKVPAGDGLWPAFWMLGNDIDQVGWPQSGEIDIVEYVGKDPNAVYGTLHGPDHFGGNAYGSGAYDLGQPVADNFHLFAVEWEEDVVRWYIDDNNFWTATKTGLMEQFNVTEEAWVYDHPFFLLLNLAIGGNFPGNPTPDTPFPAEMIVDYVRVYQAPDTSDRFATTFEDNFSGWQQVTLPFADFTPTSGVTGTLNQPSNLSQMWGYRFDVPADSQGHFYLDQILLTEAPTAPSMQYVYLPLILK